MNNRTRIALGVVLILLGVILLAERLEWIALDFPFWTIIMALVGLVGLAVAATDRDNWWAFIPGCLFLAVAGLVYVTTHDLLDGDVAAGGFLILGIGLPFWLILLVRGRSFWWAAIPGGVLTFIGLTVALASVAGDFWIGPLFLWGIAVAFWVVFALNRAQWWALIPAGVLTTVGTMPLVADVWEGTLVAGLFFVGLSLTFLLVYLLSGWSDERQGWALWPTAGCLAMGIGIPVLGTWADLLFPSLLILAGVGVLVFMLRRGRLSGGSG